MPPDSPDPPPDTSMRCTRAPGNKVDLVKNDSSARQVGTEDAQAYADDHGLFFLETSAKESTNVDTLFEEIAKRLPRAEVPRQPAGGLPLEQAPPSQGSGSKCCS